MAKINIGKLSDYLVNIGVVLSLLNVYLIYRTQKSLPEGVCAIDNNRGFIMLSVGIIIVGFILSFFDKKKPN